MIKRREEEEEEKKKEGGESGGNQCLYTERREGQAVGRSRADAVEFQGPDFTGEYIIKGEM